MGADNSGEKNSTHFKIWCRTVDPQSRIRLDAELVKFVPWLDPAKNRDLACIAQTGPEGELQILQNIPHGELLSGISKSLAQVAADASEASASWLRFARVIATQWPLTCSYDRKNKRFTIVLPKEARDLGLAPSAGSTAVIFAAGGLLEIWRASTWLEHIHKAHAELPTIIEAAADEIERRGS